MATEERVSPSPVLGILKNRTGRPPWYLLHPAVLPKPGKALTAQNQGPGREFQLHPSRFTQIAEARNSCTSPSQQLGRRVIKIHSGQTGPAKQVVGRVVGKTQIKSQRPGFSPALLWTPFVTLGTSLILPVPFS